MFLEVSQVQKIRTITVQTGKKLFEQEICRKSQKMPISYLLLILFYGNILEKKSLFMDELQLSGSSYYMCGHLESLRWRCKNFPVSSDLKLPLVVNFLFEKKTSFMDGPQQSGSSYYMCGHFLTNCQAPQLIQSYIFLPKYLVLGEKSRKVQKCNTLYYSRSWQLAAAQPTTYIQHTPSWYT